MGFWRNIIDKIGQFLDKVADWLNPEQAAQPAEQQGTPVRSTLQVAEERAARIQQQQGMDARGHTAAPPPFASAAPGMPPVPEHQPYVAPSSAAVPPQEYSQQVPQPQPQMPAAPAQAMPSPAAAVNQMRMEPGVSPAPAPMGAAPAAAPVQESQNPGGVQWAHPKMREMADAVAAQEKPAPDKQAGQNADGIQWAHPKLKEMADAIMAKETPTKLTSSYEAALRRHDEKEAARPSQPMGGSGIPEQQAAYSPQQEVLPPQRESSRSNVGVYVAGDMRGGSISATNADVVVGGNVRDSHISVGVGGVAVGGEVRNSVIEQNGNRGTPQPLSGTDRSALDNEVARLRNAFGSAGQSATRASGATFNIGSQQANTIISTTSANTVEVQSGGGQQQRDNYGISDGPVYGDNYGIANGPVYGDNYGISDGPVYGDNYGTTPAEGSGQGRVASSSSVRGGGFVSMSGSGDLIMQAGRGGHTSVTMGNVTGVSGGVVHGDVVMGSRGRQGTSVVHGDVFMQSGSGSIGKVSFGDDNNMSVVMGNTTGVSGGDVHGNVIMHGGSHNISSSTFGSGSIVNFGGNSVVGDNNTVTSGYNSPITVSGRGNGGSAVTFGDNSPITVMGGENGRGHTVQTGNTTITGMTGRIYTVEGGGSMTIRNGEVSVNNLRENGRATAIAVGPEQSAKMDVHGRDGNTTTAHAKTGREGGVAVASVGGDGSRVSLNLGGGSHVGSAASQPDKAPTVPKGDSGPAKGNSQGRG